MHASPFASILTKFTLIRLNYYFIRVDYPIFIFQHFLYIPDYLPLHIRVPRVPPLHFYIFQASIKRFRPSSSFFFFFLEK